MRGILDGAALFYFDGRLVRTALLLAGTGFLGWRFPELGLSQRQPNLLLAGSGYLTVAACMFRYWGFGTGSQLGVPKR